MDSNSNPSRSWTEIQQLRDGLFDRAKSGEITGAEADAEAVRLGLGCLSQSPAPEEHRAEAETQWSLPMAVAWIAFLDLDVVRDWSADYRACCSDWIWRRWQLGPNGPIHEGWTLEPRRKPTLSLLAMRGTLARVEDEPTAMSVNQAREALWFALKERFFAATGVDTETGRRIEIPALEWGELVAVVSKDDEDEVRRGGLGHGYRDILLPSGALQRVWRRPPPVVDVLPSTVAPMGDGFMPLYCAAQWIATAGGTLQFPPADRARWRSAYDALLAAVTSGKLRVVGLRAGVREIIPSYVFAGIQVDYPFTEPEMNLMAGEELYLRSYPYLNEEKWREGCDDALVQRREEKWTQLMVDKASLREIWSFSLGDETTDQRTGLAGRPGKSRHLIEDELRRRGADNRLAQTLSAEALALQEWLAKTHPKAPRPTVRVIANNIRDDYRELTKSMK